MVGYRYDDIRVTFEPGLSPDTYRVIAVDGAIGAYAEGTFTVPVGADELFHVASRAGHLAQRDVGGATQAETLASAEDVGGRLAQSLLSGNVGALYAAAMNRVERTTDRGVRLSLSLGKAPRLLDVPWELLFVRPRFLASQRRTPVVRVIEAGAAVDAAAVDGALRILGVVASPSNLSPLDVEAERAGIERAVAAERANGAVSIDWLQPASPAALRRALRDGSYHVVHFVGHSDFTAAGEGVIFLEGDEREAVEVDETLLANLVSDQSATLRLVVLNSCHGARSRAEDPQAGVAATLLSLGLPAVVAMQFAISDAAAIAFADELYTNLVEQHQPIDGAVSEARKAIYTDVSATEWATPVLFLRDPSAALFTFPTTSSAAPADNGATTREGQEAATGRSAISVVGSGPVAIGGNITISGTNAAGRDLVVPNGPNEPGGAP